MYGQNFEHVQRRVGGNRYLKKGETKFIFPSSETLGKVSSNLYGYSHRNLATPDQMFIGLFNLSC
jgi:hypothetical protein